MKANKLMIGDWVYSAFSELPCKVTYLKLHESGYASVETTNVVGVKDIESLSPIPLTPEILEKNGFEKQWQDNYEYFDDDENLNITFLPKSSNYTDGAYDYIDIEKGCLTINEMPIAFVHELQHVLILCGSEKTIEL